MFSVFNFSQVELKTEKDSLSENNLSIVVDVVNRYIWRGQSWGGNYTAIQPTIEYKISKKITFGTWATYNFKKEYFYPDGSTYYKGYQEIDLYLNYKITDILSLKIWDYYWPSVQKISGVNNSYFNYSNNSSKTIDFNVIFDFEKIGKPITFTVSTFLAGSDYRINTEGKYKQNYTTYLEVGHTSTFLKKIKLNSVVGLVINNQAGYYSAGNYKKPSFVNLSLKATKDIFSHRNYVIPIFLNYVHNASSSNTETFGRNFFLFGMSLKYN